MSGHRRHRRSIPIFGSPGRPWSRFSAALCVLWVASQNLSRCTPSSRLSGPWSGILPKESQYGTHIMLVLILGDSCFWESGMEWAESVGERDSSCLTAFSLWPVPFARNFGKAIQYSTLHRPALSTWWSFFFRIRAISRRSRPISQHQNAGHYYQSKKAIQNTWRIGRLGQYTCNRWKPY